MKRYAQVIRVKPEAVEAYKQIHVRVWPEALAMIHACHIRNYSIFWRGEWLFAYFEYHGDDFAADMARMAADPKTREWWTHTDPMQTPLPDRAAGEWWAQMAEVFHTE